MLLAWKAVELINWVNLTVYILSDKFHKLNNHKSNYLQVLLHNIKCSTIVKIQLIKVMYDINCTIICKYPFVEVVIDINAIKSHGVTFLPFVTFNMDFCGLLVQ